MYIYIYIMYIYIYIYMYNHIINIFIPYESMNTDYSNAQPADDTSCSPVAFRNSVGKDEFPKPSCEKTSCSPYPYCGLQ